MNIYHTYAAVKGEHGEGRGKPLGSEASSFVLPTISIGSILTLQNQIKISNLIPNSQIFRNKRNRQQLIPETKYETIIFTLQGDTAKLAD